ncbi:MAG: LacI family DNA-binding transcriptional regulator [Hyphomicrobiales bacterium]
MNDVASHAGVSQATVSLVLNGSPGAKLSESTHKRVQKAAKELGYNLPRRSNRPAPIDQSVIAFIVDELASDPWMSMAFEGAREKAMEYGLNIYLAMSNGDAANELSIIENLKNQPLVGIIYGTVLTRQVEPIEAMTKHRLVLLNCYDATRQMHSVTPGDRLGGQMATQRLIDAGRSRIGFINGQHGVDAARDRLKGYRQALSSNDIPFDPSLIRSGNWEPSSGYDNTKSLMSIDNPPDAIFCGNDLMALGCFEALHELGISIPEEISVIGFDDRDIAKHTHPPLTTLLLPHTEMGSIAAERLIELASGLVTSPPQIKIECPLTERGSV